MLAMRRRGLILGFGAAAIAGAAALPPARVLAREPGRVYRLGVLTGLPRTSPNYQALYDGLARLGFVAGKNLDIDEHGHGLAPDQYAAHAAALVAEPVDLIQCSGADAFRAAQRATQTIPIIGGADDMVGEGFTRSLAHPGGNTTGVSILAPELDGKRLQILFEMLPGVRRLGALAGGDSATLAHLAALQAMARRNGAKLVARTAESAERIGPALDALKADGAAAVNVLASAMLFFNRRLILDRTATLRLPAIYQWPALATEGGLVGYGPDLVRIYGDQLSRIAAEILRGTKPADIPVEHPTRFYLAINRKTANALRLAIPPLLMAQADEIIE